MANLSTTKTVGSPAITTPTQYMGQTFADVAEQHGVTQQEVMNEQKRAPDLKPDALVGNVLINRQKAQPIPQPAPAVVSSDLARDTINKGITSAASTVAQVGASQALPQQPADVTPDYLKMQKPEDLMAGLTSQQQSQVRQSQADLAARTQGANLQAEGVTQQRLKELADQQRLASGGLGKQLTAMGTERYAPSVAETFKVDLANKFNQQARNILDGMTSQMALAKQAQAEGDFDLTQQQLALIDQNKQKFLDMQAKTLDNQSKLLNIQKLEKADFGETAQGWVANGIKLADMPEGYLSAQDQQKGWSDGTSAGIFTTTEKEKKIADAKSAQDAASSLYSTLDKLPAGQPMKIGDHTYYGTQGTGKIEVDPQGNAYQFSVDPDTGKITKNDVGFVGKPDDKNWDTKIDDDGNMWRMNAATGQQLPFSSAKGNWDNIIPNGQVYISPINGSVRRGQCGVFVNDMTGLHMGDSLESKVALVDKSIGSGANPVRVGDAFVQAIGGWTGHTGIIEEVRMLDGKVQGYTVKDVNRNEDGKIGESFIPANSPTLRGFARGNLSPSLMTGTDRQPTFGAKAKTTGTDLLSVEEAVKLNLPYGTTKEGAIAKGIIPKGAEKPPSEVQSKAVGFASRLLASGKLVDKKLEDSIAEGSLGNKAWFMAQKKLPPELRSDSYRNFRQAEDQLINAQLRQESGAAIAPSEYESAEREYFPVPGDSASVLSQKRDARQRATNNMLRNSGDAWKDLVPEDKRLQLDAALTAGYSPAEVLSYLNVQ